MKKMKALAAALSTLALSPVAGSWLVLASLTIALPASAAAQQQTPEQVGERFLQTLKAQDWAANAALMDAAELDSMKAAFLDVAASDTSTAGLRAVFGVGSGAELRALAPVMVYQRFAANVIGQREGMAQFLASAAFRVIGHVQEGDTAYVVYRVNAAAPAGAPPGASLSQVSVITERRGGGVWKVRLNDEIQGMLTGLRMAAAQRRAANTAAAQAAGARVPAAPTAPPAAPSAAPPARP
jgi:hypothetical protein